MGVVDEAARALGYTEQSKPESWFSYGVVTAVAASTVTATVNGTESVTAARFCEAAVGDVVMLVFRGGKAAAVATRGIGADNTSVRVKLRGNTGSSSTHWYYPLCSLPANSNSSNAAAFSITGRWGGYQTYYSRYGTVFVCNRASADTQMAVIDMSPIISGTVYTPFADIVVYEESDGSATIYCDVRSYHACDLRVDMLSGYGIDDNTPSKSGQFLFDGTYTLAPTGTAGAAANSTANLLYIGNSGIKADNITAGTLITSPVVQGNTSWYGRNSTAAGTAAKTITCSDFVLVKGALLTVYSTTANTVTGSISLNVNDTGAKTVSINGSTTTSPQWAANTVTQYIYTGTYWLLSSSTSA